MNDGNNPVAPAIFELRSIEPASELLDVLSHLAKTGFIASLKVYFYEYKYSSSILKGIFRFSAEYTTGIRDWHYDLEILVGKNEHSRNKTPQEVLRVTDTVERGK